MMSVLVVAGAAGIASAHLLRLREATPSVAAVIWTLALSLRALTVTLVTAWLLLFFPGTHLFGALTDWCWHHLLAVTLNGHDVGHATTLVPALLGLASLASVGLASVKLARGLRRAVAGSPNRGPAGSVIVGGREVVLGVAGLRRPKVLISAGALLEFDDDELAAALAHEQAHIDRRHRYVLVYAGLCGGVARLLPGTRTAISELAFHLERDADRVALAQVADRWALVTALEKASGSRRPEQRPAEVFGGRGVDQRRREILRDPADDGRERSLIWRAFAGALVSVLLVLAVAVPPVLAAGWGVDHDAPAALHCDD